MIVIAEIFQNNSICRQNCRKLKRNEINIYDLIAISLLIKTQKEIYRPYVLHTLYSNNEIISK
jgi:hypothetical protein